MTGGDVWIATSFKYEAIRSRSSWFQVNILGLFFFPSSSKRRDWGQGDGGERGDWMYTCRTFRETILLEGRTSGQH